MLAYSFIIGICIINILQFFIARIKFYKFYILFNTFLLN